MFKVSYKIHTTLRYFKKRIYFYIRKVRQTKIITKVICMLLPVKTKVDFLFKTHNMRTINSAKLHTLKVMTWKSLCDN